MTETTQKKEIPLEDRLKLIDIKTVWTVSDIADFLTLSARHTRDRLVKSPGFPLPVPLPGAGNRPTLRWYKADVTRWLKQRIAA